MKNGTVFKDNFEGLGTMIEKTDKDLFINGVEITFRICILVIGL